MRLKGAPDAARSKNAARGLERGLYGRRMMSVIVDQGDAAPLADELESPPNAPKFLQAFADIARRYADFMTQRRGRQGVQHIVPARNLQRDFAEKMALMIDTKPQSAGSAADVRRPPVGFLRPAKCRDRSRRLSHGGQSGRAIAASQEESVGRNVAGEFGKRPR